MLNRSIFFVALGGMFGCVARYLIGVAVARQFPSPFPLGTLIINVVGCFLIGLFFALSEKGNVLTPEWRLFLTTGFCGGFTTFSTFSYESMGLIRDGEYIYLSLYVSASILIGFAGTFLGATVTKYL